MLISSSTVGWTPPTTLSMWRHSGKLLMVRKLRDPGNTTDFSFLGGNWMYFENGCRDFVVDRQLDLVVYTGT